MNRSIALAGSAVVVSWLGEVVHNAIELPQLTVLSAENSLPGLLSLVLFLGWWLFPTKRAFAICLLAWALLHLTVGGILTVLPLPILPFYPEQTSGHYAAHLVYSLAQIPIILLMIRELRWKEGKVTPVPIR